VRTQRSTAARINAERLVILGWGRAVLLQLAHPLVAAGVAHHSSFRASPIDKFARFQRTLGAMLAFTYGDEDTAQATADHINRIHDRVNGSLSEATGALELDTPYSAHDPELLRWVHGTLLDSTLRSYELFVGALDRATQDSYCRESTAVGPLLGIPDNLLPRSRRELDQYLESMMGSGLIAVGPTAHGLARDLLSVSPGALGAVELPVVAPYRLLTIGLLPPSIRKAYGFRWGRLHNMAFRAAVKAIRISRTVTPEVIAQWPPARSARDASSTRAA
jgi:uncharacterized protein (DUF2236 family)